MFNNHVLIGVLSAVLTREGKSLSETSTDATILFALCAPARESSVCTTLEERVYKHGREC